MTMLTLELHTIFSAAEIKNGRKSMQISVIYLFEILRCIENKNNYSKDQIFVKQQQEKSQNAKNISG